jgi:DNA-binding HxlR family transcriptional regulator
VGDACPIDRTLQVVGSRSAFLLLRESFYGATRFDDLVRLTGFTEAVAANRLKELVDHGLLERRPYREPGQRTRQEYVLTERGHDLLPALFALAQWGRKHSPAKGGPTALHEGCDAEVRVVMQCVAGHRVGEDELVVTS